MEHPDNKQVTAMYDAVVEIQPTQRQCKLFQWRDSQKPNFLVALQRYHAGENDYRCKSLINSKTFSVSKEKAQK